MSNPPYSFHNVLTPAAVEKLKSHGLLSAVPGDHRKWNIEPLSFYTDYPFVKFHHNAIPAYFNCPGIYEYLGFVTPYASLLFVNRYILGLTSRSDTILAVHQRIDRMWDISDSKGATMCTPAATTIMREIGLHHEAIAEVSELYAEFLRNERILQEYFDKNPDKNADNVELVDFCHALVDFRMKKLANLNNVVLRMLP